MRYAVVIEKASATEGRLVASRGPAGGLLHPSLWKACPATGMRRRRPLSEQRHSDQSFHSVSLGSNSPQAYRKRCSSMGWLLVTSPERRHSRPKDLPRPQRRRNALATCDLLIVSTNRW